MTDHSSALWRDIQDEIRIQIERSLTPTGVVPAVYNGLNIDRFGRVLNAKAGAFIGALAFGKTTVSASDGVQTTMSVAAPQFDTGSLYASGTDSRLVAPFDGYYFGIATIAFATNSTGDRYAALAQVDAAGADLGVIFVTQHAGAASGRATIIQTAGPYYLTAGQGFQMRGFQNSGGALNMTTASSLAMWLLK